MEGDAAIVGSHTLQVKKSTGRGIPLQGYAVHTALEQYRRRKLYALTAVWNSKSIRFGLNVMEIS